MSVVEKIALGLTLLFLVVVCLRLFAAPLKLALKVVFNSALGFGALWLLNLTTTKPFSSPSISTGLVSSRKQTPSSSACSTSSARAGSSSRPRR